MISSILEHYNIRDFKSEILVNGLINKTWKITAGADQYILQRINDHVFKNPTDIAANLDNIDTYLRQNSPGYLFVAPLKSASNQPLTYVPDYGYYRLFPFVPESHTMTVVTSPLEAFEAASQFGKFTRLLSGFDAGSLHVTIPDFHNLALRYRQFEMAITTGNANRISESAEAIETIRKRIDILNDFESLKLNGSIRQRVIHHDTKISNVLFDAKGRGICIIDLDTVMPGFFISDVGDMMRTYLSPASEEEKDFSRIEVRDDYFKAIVQGYLNAMHDELTADEQHLFYYAGTFLVYMQAIRFLADYCNDDVYYGASYEGQNFIRTMNQLTLLQRLEEKKPVLERIVANEIIKIKR
ncbi:MAG: aminoglycoside phosphotransferase family protein [Chryseolinea sp.]